MDHLTKKLPYYPLYVDDFDEDPFVLEMNLQEVGLYQLSLNEAWKRGSIPDDPRALAMLIRREPREVARAWPKVRARFVENGTPGRMVNPRQELERVKAIKKSSQAKDAALARHSAHADAYPSAPQDPIDAVASASADIARGRASESLFVSNSSSEVKPTNEEKTSTRASKYESGGRDLVLTSPDCISDESSNLHPIYILRELKPIYASGGVPVSDKHDQLIIQYLVGISPAGRRRRVVDYVKWAFVTGKWPTPAKTKGLLNLLREGDWDVELTQRSLPQAATQKNARQAARDAI